MADYYPLVAKAIAGLEKNTGEARRALYERARTALVAQLQKQLAREPTTSSLAMKCPLCGCSVIVSR